MVVDKNEEEPAKMMNFAAVFSNLFRSCLERRFFVVFVASALSPVKWWRYQLKVASDL